MVPSPCRLGMIVPSSNTVFEPEAARLLVAWPGVSLHFSRVRVTSVSLAEPSLAQFNLKQMCFSASLLADARVDVVVWAGTAGLWLGLQHDRAMVDAISALTGVPATTSTLAILQACRDAGASSIALATPYEPDVVARIGETFAREGMAVVAERHLGVRDNYSFGLVSPATVRDMVLDLAGTGRDSPAGSIDAVVVACTNLAAATIADELRQVTGVPVVDSIEATVSHALSLAGPRPGA